MLMDFRLVSEIGGRFFFENFVFHMLLWICGLQFWLHCRNVYDKKPTFFRSTSKTDKKTPKKIFSLNGSFRHVKHSSNNPTEKILNKKPKVLRSVSEKDWEGEIYSGKFFSLKCSSRRAKRRFDNPVKIYRGKAQIVSLKLQKRPKKVSRRENFSLNCSYGHVESVNDNPDEKFSPERQFFSSEFENVINKSSKFLCRKLFSKEGFFGNVESSFVPVNQISGNCRRFFDQCPKLMK